MVCVNLSIWHKPLSTAILHCLMGDGCSVFVELFRKSQAIFTVSASGMKVHRGCFPMSLGLAVLVIGILNLYYTTSDFEGENCFTIMQTLQWGKHANISSSLHKHELCLSTSVCAGETTIHL